MMNDRKTYTVLGAGWQGTAAAYDFGKYGHAARILIADIDEDRAVQAALRLNALLQDDIVVPVRADVTKAHEIEQLLRGVDVCLSAVPYYFNVDLTRAAIRAGCHFCDLGGNTDVVFQQHELSDMAKQQGVTIAPDCGLAPGMANILAVYGMRRLKHPHRVRIYVGGLPQEPQPPLDYALTFSIEGLTNEYFGKAYVLRGGEITQIDAFAELEPIEFPPPLGRCEAFITVGGTSTCPWTFAGVLDEYIEKTVRYPGHYEKMKTIYDLGLLDEKPVQVDGVKISPRNVFHAVAGPRLLSEDPRDVVALRVVVSGDEGEVTIELIDFYDDELDFTAMQRTTGFGAAIVGIMLAQGEFPPGSIKLEEAVDPEKYVEALGRRGFDLKIDARMQS